MKKPHLTKTIIAMILALAMLGSFFGACLFRGRVDLLPGGSKRAKPL